MYKLLFFYGLSLQYIFSEVIDINKYTNWDSFFTNQGLLDFTKELIQNGSFYWDFKDELSVKYISNIRAVRAGKAHSLYIIDSENPLFIKLYKQEEYNEWVNLSRMSIIKQYSNNLDRSIFPLLVIPIFSCKVFTDKYNFVCSYFPFIPGLNLVESICAYSEYVLSKKS